MRVLGEEDVPCHLTEELDERGMHKSRTPHWYGEHDLPSWRCNSSFRIDRQLDLVELALEPVVVAAVVMQFPEYTHRLVRAIGLNKIPRRFWEEHDTADDY
jgi:hypothetical protein